MLSSNKAELSAVSLFSGGGGFDLGIEAVGFNTLFATDNDSACCLTLRTNQENAETLNKHYLKYAKIIQVCVRTLDASTILQSINYKAGEIDLLIGGPPCQTFSVIGRRNGRNDPRGALLDDYLRILSGIQPKVFVFENVKGIKSIDGGALFDNLLARMNNPAPGLTYRLSELCLNASEYGVPQNRERIFIIGSRRGTEIKEIPKITGDSSLSADFVIAKRTVEDAFRGLPNAGSAFPQNHIGRVHSGRIIERYASLAPGQRDPKTRINKLDMSRPGFTIVSGSSNSGGKGHIHPIEPREVTPRESARLQSFPDWWQFEGTQVCNARHQIGNAVPPLLAATIANEIRYREFALPKVEFREFVSVLDQQHLEFPTGNVV